MANLPWTSEDLLRLAHVLVESKMTLAQLLDEMESAAKELVAGRLSGGTPTNG